MKEFRCLAFTDANFSVSTRTDAIRKAIAYLTAKIDTREVGPNTVYRWTALDGSGFTVRINPSTTRGSYAALREQWNAYRN